MRTFSFLGGFSLGISIFLLGLKLLASSLESALGHRLRPILTRFTATKWQSLLAGAFSTCLIQSSSAVASTMVVLVHSGILTLKQAFGIILGANIGTTLTAQIIAFRLGNAALPLMLAGLLVFIAGRTGAVGTALFALGSLFFGLTITTATLSPLLQLPAVHILLTDFTRSPWQACLVGMVLTALVQSSSAVTGVVISLAHLGSISLPAAAGIALGSNVGTVVTTLLATVNRGRESKATAYADLFFNLGGVLLILPFFGPFLGIIARISSDPARQIAHAHTVFNVITALLALPFLENLAALAWWWAGIRIASKK
ncbi:MAG: Na/Pi cotransporter family protein [Firmicutes bacterium]|nr:Na/Pi cotransporter family protein [Bacillota bacterium]